MSSKPVTAHKGSSTHSSTLFSRCTPRLRKARSNQRSTNNCYGLSFTVKALTWVSDSHGLFDYESRNLHLKNFSCRGLYGSYEVVRIGVDVKLLNSEDAHALKASDSRCKTLVKLYCKDGGYSLVGDIDDPSATESTLRNSIFSNNSRQLQEDENDAPCVQRDGTSLEARSGRDISVVSVAAPNTAVRSLITDNRHQIIPMVNTNGLTQHNNHNTANEINNSHRSHALLESAPPGEPQQRINNSSMVADHNRRQSSLHDLWLVVRQRGVSLHRGDVLRVGRHQLSIKELVYDTPVSSHISTYLGNEDCDTVAPSQDQEQSAVLSDNDIPTAVLNGNATHQHHQPEEDVQPAASSSRLSPGAAVNFRARSSSLTQRSRRDSIRGGCSDNSASGNDSDSRRVIVPTTAPGSSGAACTSVQSPWDEDQPQDTSGGHRNGHQRYNGNRDDEPTRVRRPLLSDVPNGNDDSDNGNCTGDKKNGWRTGSSENKVHEKYADAVVGTCTDHILVHSNGEDLPTPVRNNNTVDSEHYSGLPVSSKQDNTHRTRKTTGTGGVPRVTVHRSSSELPPCRRRRRASDASSSSQDSNSSSSSEHRDGRPFAFPNSDVEVGTHSPLEDSIVATGRRTSHNAGDDDFRSADEGDFVIGSRNVSRMSTGSSHVVTNNRSNEEGSRSFTAKDGLNYSLSSLPTCRICLCEEDMPNVNPLIAPCECRGSMKYVHLQCLRTWMQGRLGVDSEGTSISFFWRVLDCELCQENYPSMVDVSPVTVGFGSALTSKYIELFQLPRPKPPYIILEPQDSDGNGLHFVSFSSVKIARLGRGHNADVRIGDISVSRQHAWLKYVPHRNPGSSGQNVGTNTGFYLEDLQSKFGTLVQLRTPYRVTPGRNIPLQIGRTVLVFCIKRNWRLLGHSWFQSGRIRPDIVCQLISSDVTASEAVTQDGVLHNFNGDGSGDCVRNLTQ
eukprot:Lankesteria_metandrocarpae@DN4758_c0_g1_i1.p1